MDDPIHGVVDHAPGKPRPQRYCSYPIHGVVDHALRGGTIRLAQPQHFIPGAGRVTFRLGGYRSHACNHESKDNNKCKPDFHHRSLI